MKGYLSSPAMVHGNRQQMRQGYVIWLTGLPASGKTTIATALAEWLCSQGFPVEVLGPLEECIRRDPKGLYAKALGRLAISPAASTLTRSRNTPR